MGRWKGQMVCRLQAPIFIIPLISNIRQVTVERLETGEIFTDEADVVISARGTLNDMSWPQVPGLAEMTIPVMHSANWNKKYVQSSLSTGLHWLISSYDFKNKRIGVIGGGSSAIQIIPSLQRVAGTQLSCFVRSKTWISRPFGDVAMEKLGIQDTHCKPLVQCHYSID